MNQIEGLILKNLIENDSYSRKVLPFLKLVYFEDPKDKLIFQEIDKFIQGYNNLPSYDAVKIGVNALSGVSDMVIKNSLAFLDALKSDTDKTDQQWLIDNTEKFCQEKALDVALMEAIHIRENKSKRSTGEIPDILKEALAICFDTNVGHDYWEDAEERYDYLHRRERKIPFNIDYLNLITKGGIEHKTLNIIMGAVNIGKTLIMCSLAADYISRGFNVLYITLEMEDMKIGERIDANLLNIALDDLEKLPKDLYLKKIEAAKQKQVGRFKLKEYPTATASTINFRSLMNDLLLKQNFKPDIVFVDYLGICASARMRASTDLYSFGKAVAEELRGFADEHKVALWTGVQINRSGFKNSDPDMDSIAESFGIPATADFCLAITSNDELEELGQYATKQIKNRYGPKHKNKRFVIGVDYTKMRVYNVEEDDQANTFPQISTSTGANPHFVDNTKFSGIKVV